MVPLVLRVGIGQPALAFRCASLHASLLTISETALEPAADDFFRRLALPVIDDPYKLQRFVTAQDVAGTYERALSELRAGRKRSHWMWFVFPQIAGLGHSPNARTYAISSLAEAKAYIAHPMLGPRLLECMRTLIALEETSVGEILGEIDAVKLRSSMTLFAAAAPHEPLFGQVLDRYFDGTADTATEQRL